MDKIWFSSYPLGVPEVIDPDQYNSLPEAFKNYCQIYAKKSAFRNFGTAITYQQLDQFSDQLAAYFQNSLGLIKGDRVALILPNILQFPVSLLATLKAGLIAVNVNPLYTATEMKYLLQNSGVKVVVVLDNFAHVLEMVLADLDIEHVMVTKIGDLLGQIKGPVFNVINQWVMKNVLHWKIKPVHDFKKAIKKGAKLSFQPPEIKRDDIAFLQYTGGTTGIPKGAMLTHRNLLANLLQCIAWVKDKLLPGQEILITALPLYHIFALTVSCLTFLGLGGECVLITDPRNIKRLVRIWRRSRPTTFIGLNTLFLHLMENKAFRKLNFNSLKFTAAGGMATQGAIAEKWQNLTGCVITEGYGLTEASPIVSINPVNLTYFNQNVGVPLPSTEIKVCDNTGKELGIDEIGELWVRGPQVMLGYWRNPEETTLVLDSQAWLKTGDMVRVDARGYIYIVDRKKDLIIVSGFNVYPNEVESLIDNHPGVAESAVVPVNQDGIETVKAIVVKTDPNLTEDALRRYCEQYLAHYKIPKIIVFQDSLPKSQIGKILRRNLRFFRF